MKTAPIISLSEFVEKATQFHYSLWGGHKGKGLNWEWKARAFDDMTTYNALISRLTKESDFMRGKKPVYNPIINRDLYRSAHKQDLAAWDNWVSLYAGECQWRDQMLKQATFNGQTIEELLTKDCKEYEFLFNLDHPELPEDYLNIYNVKL